MKYIYGLVDMQSFYASVEAASNDKYAFSRREDDSSTDPPLVVAGDPERRSGIILAATPTAKEMGVSTAMTLGEALRLDKRRELVVVRPRMQTYIDVSVRIQDSIKSHFPLQEQFSIDEAFFAMPVPSTLFSNPIECARRLKESIWDQFRIRSRIGLAPNKWLAKMTNKLSKKSKDGIVWWREEEVLDNLWPLPVTEMWGLRRRAEVLQRKFGAETIGDVAKIPLHSLQHQFGPAWGTIISRWSQGQDPSGINPNAYDSPHKGYSHRMTLPRDYSKHEDIAVVILELLDEVCARVRRAGLQGRRISVGATYAKFEGGFWKSRTLPLQSDDSSVLYPAVMQLFDDWWNGEAIRAVAVGLDMLYFHEANQLNLFHDVVRQENMNQVVDAIREKFGETAVFRCSSLLPAGQMLDRSGKIGGHFA